MTLTPNKNIWYGIQIRDPLLISGTSLRRLVKLAVSVLPVPLVAIRRVEWLGPPSLFPRLGNADTGVVTVDEFLNRAAGATQFIWGDFFFIEDPASVSLDRIPFEYAKVLARARFLICAVDNMYYYVVTQSPELSNLLKQSYPDASVEEHELHELRFPS